jgi:hypothetical protein
MMVSMSSTASLGTASDFNTQQFIRSSSAGGKAVQLSPIRTRTPNSADFTKNNILKEKRQQQAIEASVTAKKKILEKIEASPFLSPSMSSMEVLDASLKKKGGGGGSSKVDLNNNSSMSQSKNQSNDNMNMKESNFALRMHATDILSGRQKLGGGASKILLKQSTKKDVANEMQGPTDWSSQSLQTKYRGEVERETAWLTWKQAQEYAGLAISTQDIVLPIAEISRHPIYELCYRFLDSENVKSQARSLARVHMRRFVRDVQEIWLTNLPHLREFHLQHASEMDGTEGWEEHQIQIMPPLPLSGA